MKRILILKDVAIAAKIGGGSIAGINDVNQLAQGAVAIFSEDGRMMISAATANTVFTTLPNTKKIFFAVGSGDAAVGATLSSMIDRDSINVTQKAFAAAVAQVDAVGDAGAGAGALNLPSPLVVGDSAIVRLIDNSAGTHPAINKKTYEYVIKTGDTATQITAGIVALINNNPDSIVTAVDNPGLGFSLTAKLTTTTVEVLLSGVFGSSTLNFTGETFNAATRGIGLPSQVAEIEAECSAVEGNTNQLYQSQMWYKKASDVDTAASYDMYNLDWNNVKNRPTDNVIATHEFLVIAMPNAGAAVTKANFDGVLTEAFGVNRVNLETGA